jgi:dihydroxycyclohexadiene carboxylate dehydrogenase
MTALSRFADQVMMVTGAAQGIGRAVAAKAAKDGALLVLVDRADFLGELEQDLSCLTEVLAVQADLESFAGATLAVASALARFGRIDILVNVVGGTIWMKPYAEYAEHEIEAEIRRSLFPTLWCCRAVLPSMLALGQGVIVNVSSVATRGINRVPYAAAKGGINAVTACLAMEYAEHGIRVVATAPGGTSAPPRRIPRNPNSQNEQEMAWAAQVIDQTKSSNHMKRYGTLEDQANAILFLASPEAAYITGSTLPVAGGDLG